MTVTKTVTDLVSQEGIRRIGGRVVGPTFAGPAANAPVIVVALASAAVAAGAVAIGVLAIGRLAIGRAVVRDLDAERVHIGTLTVDELHVAGRSWPPSPDVANS